MALDFGHGSGLTVAPKTFSDFLNDAIDQGIIERRKRQPRRNYLGASQLGEPCGRKLCYSYAGTPPDTEITPRTQRIFDIGHNMEDFLAGQADSDADGVFKAAAARWFHDAGFDLRTRNSKGEQFRWRALDGKLSGAIDGVFLDGPKLPEIHYPCIWEGKALGKKSWNKIKKHGVKIASDTYHGQVQINMAYLGDVWWTLFTAIQKDDESLHHEMIEFDASAAQRISDRGLDVIRAVEGGSLLPRIASNSDFYLCQWCAWRKTCWSQP